MTFPQTVNQLQHVELQTVHLLIRLVILTEYTLKGVGSDPTT
jgi:hypothetical protein